MFFLYKVSWETYKPMRKESMRFKRIECTSNFSKQDGSRYSQGIEDVNKVEEKKEETDLKVQAEVASTG